MKRFIIILLCSPFLALGQLPYMNQAVLDYANKMLGKKVGSGLCGDLIGEAVTRAGGKWTYKKGTWDYGQELGENDTVMPGDIILWRRCECSDGYVEAHVAIVYKVISPGKYILIEQNLNDHKYVEINKSPFEPNKCWSGEKHGKLTFFRPESN